jgi:1,4-alpha-glucan branching enzyme
MYKLLGNKQLQVLETWGTYFAVWAPNATQVSITGYFNNWNTTNVFPRLTLDLYDDLDAFMQYDY